MHTSSCQLLGTTDMISSGYVADCPKCANCKMILLLLVLGVVYEETLLWMRRYPSRFCWSR